MVSTIQVFIPQKGVAYSAITCINEVPSYDFDNGHICKHIHHVHSLANSISASSTGADGANNLQSTLLENITDDFDTLSYADSVYIPQTVTRVCSL